jgi:hypothetical protein
MKIKFTGHISKYTQISNLMKIRPKVSELFHADRKTDRHDEAKRCKAQFFERA